MKCEHDFGIVKFVKDKDNKLGSFDCVDCGQSIMVFSREVMRGCFNE